MSNCDDLLMTESFMRDFNPPELPTKTATPATIEAYDRISRHWASTHVGALRVGSEAHKREVCRMFRETFNPYRPSIIVWPKLSPEALQRLTSLPIWNIAVQTEGKARLNFAAYASSIADQEVCAALMLNAWEENRHKEVLSNLVKTYKIPLENEPAYERPRNLEWAYLVTGYSECIDSFFAFGLFEVARRSGFFPAKLVETFEPPYKKNAAISCFSPTGWLGIVRIYAGGAASTLSFVLPRSGFTSCGSASSWLAAWAWKATLHSQTATSR